MLAATRALICSSSLSLVFALAASATATTPETPSGVAPTVAAAGRGSPSSGPVAAQTQTSDLDAFMARVLARRDDNWARLQQYVLDERERAELRGPGDALLYGLERDFLWYIRDGVFVRSPVRADGVALSDEERRQYEDEWLAREKRREAEQAEGQPPPAARAASSPAGDAETLARLVREPRFVSAAYFLKFKFERGRYAFVGPELYDGRRVLRIEYYPERLFADGEDEEHDTAQVHDDEDAQERRLERQMNKVALVTLWVEPETHQIVKYTFDNVGMDFMPGRSLVRVDELTATMEMGQPFEGVWLPNRIRGHGALTLANGTYEVRYQVTYENYREAEVKARIR
jgi:hypothetical protein